MSKGGDGVAVVAIDHKGSSINVSVGPYNGHDPTERELQLMLSAGEAATKRDFPGIVIIAKGLRYLSGKKGPYQKFRVVYSAQGYSVTNVTANYTVFMNRRVYTITASAPLNSYAEIEPLLNASISSFAVRGFQPQDSTMTGLLAVTTKEALLGVLEAIADLASEWRRPLTML